MNLSVNICNRQIKCKFEVESFLRLGRDDNSSLVIDFQRGH